MTAPAATRFMLRVCWPRVFNEPSPISEPRSSADLRNGGRTSMPLPLLPTSLVGSYAQPEWLIDRQKLAGRFPPRVRAKELWRIPPEYLAQAQDDATLL